MEGSFHFYNGCQRTIAFVLLSTLCWLGVGETSSLALADTRRISKHEETETHIQFQSKDLEPVFRRFWELDGSIKLYCFHLTWNF